MHGISDKEILSVLMPLKKFLFPGIGKTITLL